MKHNKQESDKDRNRNRERYRDLHRGKTATGGNRGDGLVRGDKEQLGESGGEKVT